MQKNFRRTLFKVNNVQMTTITKSKSVSFSILSRPTDPVLLLIFYLQQEIKVEWPKHCMALEDMVIDQYLLRSTSTTSVRLLMLMS